MSLNVFSVTSLLPGYTTRHKIDDLLTINHPFCYTPPYIVAQSDVQRTNRVCFIVTLVLRFEHYICNSIITPSTNKQYQLKTANIFLSRAEEKHPWVYHETVNYFSLPVEWFGCWCSFTSYTDLSGNYFLHKIIHFFCTSVRANAIVEDWRCFFLTQLDLYIHLYIHSFICLAKCMHMRYYYMDICFSFQYSNLFKSVLAKWRYFHIFL